MNFPAFLMFAFAAAAAVLLGARGLRVWLAMRDAYSRAELALTLPKTDLVWLCAFAGTATALIVFVCIQSMEPSPWVPSLAVGAGAAAAVPTSIDTWRGRVAARVNAELAVHLDLLALHCEAGTGLDAAISACIAQARVGPLRGAWLRLLGELRASENPSEVWRAMDLRCGIPAISLLASSMRSAERSGLSIATALRTRASAHAAWRFAVAEHRARAAPVKLWATLVLCVVPCTLIVLAFPLADLLASWLG